MHTMIDNQRPADYPTFDTETINTNHITMTQIGDYIVNDDGDLLLVTSGNLRWKDAPLFVKTINLRVIRAKYIGNRDDMIEFADRIRWATVEEIAIGAAYGKRINPVDDTGNTILF